MRYQLFPVLLAVSLICVSESVNDTTAESLTVESNTGINDVPSATLNGDIPTEAIESVPGDGYVVSNPGDVIGGATSNSVLGERSDPVMGNVSDAAMTESVNDTTAESHTVESNTGINDVPSATLNGDIPTEAIESVPGDGYVVSNPGDVIGGATSNSVLGERSDAVMGNVSDAAMTESVNDTTAESLIVESNTGINDVPSATLNGDIPTEAIESVPGDGYVVSNPGDVIGGATSNSVLGEGSDAVIGNVSDAAMAGNLETVDNTQISGTAQTTNYSESSNVDIYTGNNITSALSDGTQNTGSNDGGLIIGDLTGNDVNTAIIDIQQYTGPNSEGLIFGNVKGSDGKNAITDPVRNTDVLYPGPYVSPKEINADNDTLFHDQGICKKCNPHDTSKEACYLQHPLDCRKYIRCVYWKPNWRPYIMRCGLGTFWLDDRKTCQFSQKVECKTDPCRNPDLISYDNGIRQANCREFWGCENGRSVHVCCDKFYSYQNGECVRDDNCTVACPDPCANPDKKWYSDDINCRNFYKCKDTKSIPYCCPQGKSFKDGKCVNDSKCDIPCAANAILEENQDEIEKFTTTEAPSCSLEPLENGKKFQDIGNKYPSRVRLCPGGLLFSKEKCTCDFPKKVDSSAVDTVPRECKPEVCVNFEPGKNPVKVENYGVNFAGGHGEFNGDSYLAIPLLSNNERFAKKIHIKIKFNATRGMGRHRQVLVSNCRTSTYEWSKRLSPSLAILINRTQEQSNIIYLGQAIDNGAVRIASIVHSFQPSQWMGLDLVFDGERLTASTERIAEGGGPMAYRQFDTKELKGVLKVGLESFRIGKCLDSDGYYGLMDDVCIGDCLNGKEPEYI